MGFKDIEVEQEIVKAITSRKLDLRAIKRTYDNQVKQVLTEKIEFINSTDNDMFMLEKIQKQVKQKQREIKRLTGEIEIVNARIKELNMMESTLIGKIGELFKDANDSK